MSSLKRTIRSTIPLLDRAVPGGLVQSLFGRFVPIFMLHRMHHPDYGIDGMSPDILRAHLSHFSDRGYKALSLQELGTCLREDVPPPARSAVFTIDDGFIDHADIAGEIFSEFEIPLTFFLITDLIDGALWPWDDQLAYVINEARSLNVSFTIDEQTLQIDLSAPERRTQALRKIREILKSRPNHDIYQRVTELARTLQVDLPSSAPSAYTPMSWEDANRLSRAGHDVAAHTRSHRILSRLEDDAATEEIVSSIDRVNTMVADAANVFAYPTGRAADFSERECRILEDQNITTTVSTVTGHCSPHNDYTLSDTLMIQQLPRFPLPEDKVDFIQYLGWVEYMKNRFRGH